MIWLAGNTAKAIPTALRATHEGWACTEVECILTGLLSGSFNL